MSITPSIKIELTIAKQFVFLEKKKNLPPQYLANVIPYLFYFSDPDRYFGPFSPNLATFNINYWPSLLRIA